MEENKLETNTQTEKIETYFNRETLENLTDPLEISYYKSLQHDEIVDNELLGEFDKSGNYLISRDVLLELVAVKKIIKESKDNKYILSAPVSEGIVFLFTLQIEDDGDKKIAIMKMIENDVRINGIKEIIKTNIARYKDDNDIYFMTKVKKIFNIVESEGNGKEINNEEFLKIIIKRIKDFKSLKKQDAKFEENAKQYLDQIIDILTKNPGKFSEYILRKYNILLEESKELIGKPKYYKNLKIKLDNLINETRKSLKDSIIENLIKEARKQFLENNKQIQKEILEPKVAIKPNAKEKPKEKKAEGADKKIANKKSGPKKAPPKKKSAKKEADKSIVYKRRESDNIQKNIDFFPKIETKEPNLKKALLDAQLASTHKLLGEKFIKNQDTSKVTIVANKISPELDASQKTNEQTL